MHLATVCDQVPVSEISLSFVQTLFTKREGTHTHRINYIAKYRETYQIYFIFFNYTQFKVKMYNIKSINIFIALLTFT